MLDLTSVLHRVTRLFDRLPPSGLATALASGPATHPDLAEAASGLLSRPAELRERHVAHSAPGGLSEGGGRPQPHEPAEPSAWPESLPDITFDALVLTDAAGAVLDANRAACELLSLSREQLRGRRLADHFDPRAAGPFPAQPASEPVAGRGPVPLFRDDGTVRAVEWRASEPDSAGRRLLVLRDVTYLRAMEEHARQSQKLEAVGWLALGAAHDFNNLLTAVNGWAELVLADPGASDAVRVAAGEIAKAGARASAITRRLLTFGRQPEPEPGALDVGALLLDMDKMLRRLLGDSVEFQIVTAPGSWPVRADAGEVGQVLMNLIVNARDAITATGRVTVATTNAQLDDDHGRRHEGARPGEYLRLTVSDTGCGMEPAILARIFEPFFTTKGPDRGTGLGLAIVRDIVRKSGGHVEVQSEPGRGTTLAVYLPRARPD